jgi:alginate O-acetyltransferase complex protein AlgI
LAFLSAPFFVLVLLATLAVACCRRPHRPYVLLLASLVFYALGDPAGLLVLLALAAAVYGVAFQLGGSRGSRRFAGAVAGLFAILCLFKVAQAGLIGEGEGRIFGHLMPLGLSYFVFKLTSYLVEVYWQRMPPEPSIARLSLYALFFPQIVSGPIQRPGHFLDQLDALEVRREGVDRGLRLILFGLLQKVVADQIGVLVASVYRAPASFSPLELLIGLYAFAFQLYLDFAGITDVAIGLGAFFGIDTPHNFDRPFFATGIQDFWRRWHMTLSSWLADYVFTPLWHALGYWGSAGLAIAVLANMLGIGLWHGARWTFVLFGLLNGVYMTISVLSRRRRSAFFANHRWLRGGREVASRLLTFHVMAAFFVFVRADSLAQATAYLKGLLSITSIDALTVNWSALGTSASTAVALLACVVAAECVHWLRRSEGALRLLPLGRGLGMAAVAALVVYLVLCRDSVQQEFLYAQF